jgi:hypothetical protein
MLAVSSPRHLLRLLVPTKQARRLAYGRLIRLPNTSRLERGQLREILRLALNLIHLLEATLGLHLLA